MAYRIIQWATGNTGIHALRGILRHPDLELVGLKVFSDSKNGRDAGEIAGLLPCGIRATQDDEALIATAADAVCFMAMDPGLVSAEESGAHARNQGNPLKSGTVAYDQVETICRLLESGKSVVSTTILPLQNPKAFSPEINERLERACQAGGTSFQCVGIHPGHMDVNVLLPLTAFSESIKSIHVSEVINYAEYNQPETLFDRMGFGKTPAELRERRQRVTGEGEWQLEARLAPMLHLIGQVLGVEVEEFRPIEHEIALAPEDFDIAAGHIAKGTLAALHFGVQGVVDNVPRVTIEWFTRVHPDVAPDWPSVGASGDGYILRIEGSPSLRMTLEFTGEGGTSPMNDACQATAMVALHSIPLLCEAEPGVKTFLNLPPLVGTKVLRSGT